MYIPEPIPPTTEEMTVSANNWWDIIQPTTFLSYNDELLKNTLPLTIIPLPHDIVADTLTLMDKPSLFYEVLKKYEVITAGKIPQGDFFIKLISRSPKDANESGRNKSIEESLQHIAASMRCMEDLCLFNYIDTAALVIRPFVDYNRAYEFRVFVKYGQIVAISQYYYDQFFEELTGREAQIKGEIDLFINSIVTPNMPIKTFVADVITAHHGFEKTMLLETNPYGLSDPCLYTYDTFDKGIKITPYK